MPQLLLPFPARPGGSAFRFPEGTLVVQASSPGQDEDREVGRSWQVRFSTPFRDLHAQELRSKHPTWSERKIAARAVEEARPFGDPDVIHCYCRAIPHGSHPQGIKWFEESELRSTGLSWRVPSWDEIARWFLKDGPRFEYAEWINDFGVSYPPLSGEADLVRLLAGIDPFWSTFLAQNPDFPFSRSPAPGRSSRDTANAGELPLFA